MKGFDVILALLIAVCEIIEIALFLTCLPTFWLWFNVFCFLGLLTGVVRYRYTEQDSNEMNRWKAWVSILLILNFVFLGLLGITGLDYIGDLLNATFIIPVINSEELVYYIAIKRGKESLN